MCCFSECMTLSLLNDLKLSWNSAHVPPSAMDSLITGKHASWSCQIPRDMVFPTESEISYFKNTHHHEKFVRWGDIGSFRFPDNGIEIKTKDHISLFILGSAVEKKKRSLIVEIIALRWHLAWSRIFFRPEEGRWRIAVWQIWSFSCARSPRSTVQHHVHSQWSSTVCML